jgi:tRNA nucleotidyltransferase (CCA-adding enzyme)
MDAFKSMIKYDRNIQSLVDKIFPDHASSSATKLVLRQDAKIDLNVLFPDNAPQEETEEEEVEEEPYDVMVRILPMKTYVQYACSILTY